MTIQKKSADAISTVLESLSILNRNKRKFNFITKNKFSRESSLIRSKFNFFVLSWRRDCDLKFKIRFNALSTTHS